MIGLRSWRGSRNGKSRDVARGPSEPALVLDERGVLFRSLSGQIRWYLDATGLYVSQYTFIAIKVTEKVERLSTSPFGAVA